MFKWKSLIVWFLVTFSSDNLSFFSPPSSLCIYLPLSCLTGDPSVFQFFPSGPSNSKGLANNTPNTSHKKPTFEMLIEIIQKTPIILQATGIALGWPQR